MHTLLNILIIAVLGMIVIEDLRHRAVHWYWFVLAFVFITAKALMLEEKSVILTNGFSNMGYIVLQLVVLSVYFTLKEKKWINIIDTRLGLGDIIFFIAISGMFSPYNFILFFVASLLVSIFIFALVKISGIQKNETIPLAGLMSACLIMIFISGFFTDTWNWHNDALIFDWMYGNE